MVLKKIAWVLVIIGALNWGLVGVFQWDLVAAIFGDMSLVARIIYILVGVSALYKIFACGSCKGGSCSSHGSSKNMGGMQGGNSEM